MMTENGSKSSKKPIIGCSSLQINRQDASRLVGGIVEKGFSVSNAPSTSSAPRPTVLPFPVARHRSHGPHWIPVGGDDDYGDIEDVKEEDFTGVETIAAFAQPMQKKEKKGLDFTRWREMMSGADGFGAHKGEKNWHSIERTNVSMETQTSDGLNKDEVARIDDMPQFTLPLCDKVNAEDLDMEGMNSNVFEVVKYQEQDVSDMALDSAQESNRRYDLASGFGSNQLLNEKGAMSLESQIDAENRARLERMSSDEIAEAHTAIMAKISPALIETLKKRGQDKLKRKKCSASDMAATNEVGRQVESNLINASALSHSNSSRKVITADSKGTQKDLGNAGHLKFSPKNSSLWDAWSRRVESVREIKFSLDGNIIKSNFAPVAGFGSASARSEYNISAHDFLRTEGDPGATGYTIKEVLALTRSVVPGQRALALHLIAAILDRAIHGLHEKKIGCTLGFAETDEVIDWEAIWAFALGPEPELALSLRICLDDNHNSVVLACAKVIRFVLSCDLNESFFDTSEKLPSIQGDVYTAAVFRTKPDIDVGFLHGGFWKYSAKPSNLLPFVNEVDDKPEGEHTIQDDIAVAGQDIAAGLVRMGILGRIRYLLETQPSTSLEECLLSTLIAVARHSSTSATAILKCYRLLQTIVNRFISKEQMEISPSKIKTLILLKVLAKVDKKNCFELIKNGTFQKVTWHLVRYLSVDQWIKYGRETCKLSSALLVEQLRLWKVCITYGHCVSYFVDMFPALSIWLNVPSFEKLIKYEVLSEFAAISKEAYLVLEALTKRLPNFYSLPNRTTDLNAEEETWCWSHVGPVIDLALDWIAVKDISPISSLFDRQKGEHEYTVFQVSSINSLLWVISSVMHTISGVLEAVIPVDTSEHGSGHVPWLPEFVPKIGLKLIKNGYFLSSEAHESVDNNLANCDSFLKYLCHLRYKFGLETSIASASCLQGLVQVAVSVDRMIQLTKCEDNNLSSNYSNISADDKILTDGLLVSSLNDLRALLTTHVKFVFRQPNMQSIEIFGRGGPAPGVGVGWGASGGGFWSTAVLLAQVDARLITCLLEVFQNSCVRDLSTTEHLSCFTQMINSALEVSLTAGPRDRSVVDKLFDLLFCVPVLKGLDFGLHQFLHVTQGLKPFEWKYDEEDYQLFCAVLTSHFKSRWLSIKTKSKAMEESRYAKTKVLKKGNISLDTIYEEVEGSPYLDKSSATSLTQEWAYQMLPLPTHWFLSPISIMHCKRDASLPSAPSRANFEQEQSALLKVAQGGLFFLLGLEAMSTFLSPESHSFVHTVQVVWKLHALSVILIDGMGVLEDPKSRDVYQTLQNVYGQVVDNLPLADTRERLASGSLLFQSEVNDSYSTFVEMLVEQFAAVSYGDLVFGRQVSVYLHRHVEASVRLATWNALFNARALELLPPMEKCFGKANGYLEPIEDDEKLLEAYVKSWVSGALDKAASRRSASYTLVLHHLSSFIFTNCMGNKLSFRNQLVKSLLRDYSRKGQHQGMMMNLLQYKKPAGILNPVPEDCLVEKRLQLLRDACGGNSPLLKEVEKLKSLTEERTVCS